MKRAAIVITMLMIIICMSTRVNAEGIRAFDSDKEKLENSVSDKAFEAMDELGAGGIDDLITGGVDLKALFSYAAGLIAGNSAAPLSGLILLISALITVSLVESYTYSLRYTHTKEIMNTVTGLISVCTVLSPFADLAKDTVTVISASSSVMLVYLPVMMGLTAFSGGAISTAGYYTALVTGAGVLSKLASGVLLPVLNLILSLSVCSGVTSRFNISGIINTASKCFKWLLTFAVSLFAAVIGLNGALAGAGDTLSERAAKFTLSSFVPLIGSSVAEAYRTLKGSLTMLRSGMGVFVIIAVMVSFAPVMIRALLWSFSIGAAKSVGEIFGVSSAVHVMSALGAYMSAIRAVLIAVLTAFIISTAAIMRVGGGG